MKSISVYFYIFFTLLIGVSCSEIDEVNDETGRLVTDEFDISDWTTQSHGKDGEPNYEIVFPENEVNRIDIEIGSESWSSMQTDLARYVGNKGGGPSENNDSNPIWVSCNIFFDNTQWYKVGIRYKGNSSLHSTYRRHIKKLSFKLDFDQFEDTYPIIKNQRFFGFKQLSLKNNFEDRSFVREKVASELFSEFGIASPKTAFYRVFVNYGSGSIYFGLYTIVEEVDDTVIESHFINNDGNLYKPEGDAASFAQGTFNTDEMHKKSNKEYNDYSDVNNFYKIINSSLRISNHDAWKEQLSDIFEVSVFLKWLAANTVMQNWDTYGKMTHNYYLYNNPENKKITWIPWDNNEALQEGKRGGSLSLSLEEVNEKWPIIRYIIDDENWHEMYKTYMADFTHHMFESEKMRNLYGSYSELIREYTVGEYGETKNYTFLNNNSDFNLAIDYLIKHAEDRKNQVSVFLQ